MGVSVRLGRLPAAVGWPIVLECLGTETETGIWIDPTRLGRLQDAFARGLCPAEPLRDCGPGARPRRRAVFLFSAVFASPIALAPPRLAGPRRRCDHVLASRSARRLRRTSPRPPGSSTSMGTLGDTRRAGSARQTGGSPDHAWGQAATRGVVGSVQAILLKEACCWAVRDARPSKSGSLGLQGTRLLLRTASAWMGIATLAQLTSERSRESPRQRELGTCPAGGTRTRALPAFWSPASSPAHQSGFPSKERLEREVLACCSGPEHASCLQPGYGYDECCRSAEVQASTEARFDPVPATRQLCTDGSCPDNPLADEPAEPDGPDGPDESDEPDEPDESDESCPRAAEAFGVSMLRVSHVGMMSASGDTSVRGGALCSSLSTESAQRPQSLAS